MEQIIIGIAPAVIAALPGLFALFFQFKKDQKSLYLEGERIKIEKEISISDTSLRILERMDKDLLNLSEKIDKLERENGQLKIKIDALEIENQLLKTRIQELETKNKKLRDELRRFENGSGSEH